MATERRPSEVVFHQANARGANDEAVVAALDEEAVTILCECGQAGCDDQLTVNRQWFHGIRRHPSWSIVCDGHEVPEVSRVVQQRGSIAIVESTYVGDGEALAQ